MNRRRWHTKNHSHALTHYKNVKVYKKNTKNIRYKNNESKKQENHQYNIQMYIKQKQNNWWKIVGNYQNYQTKKQ